MKTLPHLPPRVKPIWSPLLTPNLENRTVPLLPNWHGLAKPGQSPFDAWKRANDFVRNELILAREYENKGQRDQALIHLGNAIHTMQDTTSPTHEGYQQNPRGLECIFHAAWESIEGNRNITLDAMTRKAWEIFISKEPVPKEVLPRP